MFYLVPKITDINNLTYPINSIHILVQVWRDLDKRITDRVNESKDYLKFLSTLEKVLQALYNNDPVCIL